MACRHCGACCGYVALDIRPESVLWVELHGIPLSDDGRGGKQIVIGAKCKWRDDDARRCTHYEDRPEVCRRFLCEEAKGD